MPASSSPSEPAAASTRALVKQYGLGATAVRALDGVDVAFGSGALTAIMGPSGSGKSTLLHCVAGLDRPTSGAVFVGTTEISELSERQLTRIRRDRLGFVFQAFNLVPTLDALDNITLPMTLAGRRPDPDWLESLVDSVGLRERLHHRPAELSGGQQQRVAVARALLSRPELVLADEPTGNLDSRSGAQVLHLLRDAVDRDGQTIVLVTHDPVVSAQADRVVFVADGRVVDEEPAPTADRVLDRLRRMEP